MQGTREIKGRQKSIGNIGQIARAMELVSVTKMRRSQLVALNSRPYAKAALEILKNISAKTDLSKSYFFGNFQNEDEKLKPKKTAVILSTTDKGLCGGLNTNIFRKTEKLLEGMDSNNVDFIVIGKKGAEWCRRKNLNVIKTFFNFGDYIAVKETRAVSDFVINLFQEGKYIKVFAMYTNFASALKQESVSRVLLPVREESLKEIISEITPKYGKFSGEEDVGNQVSDSFLGGSLARKKEWDFEYKFEPKAEEILDEVIMSLVEAEIYYIILENNASEHSARRMAMKNAYENADEMLAELNLTYNKARQAGITQEIAEIAAGANS